MTYKTARIGTYYNGHDSKLIDQLNEVLQDVKDDTIVHELFVNYFDDQDIEGIIEFFKDRFRDHDISKQALEMAKQNAALRKKQEIAGMLIDIFNRITIDVPDNFDEILNFVVDDVDETADKIHWHDGDVAIAFRRYIESKN